MKRLVPVLIALLPGLLAAADIAPSLRIPRLATPPRIDGRLAPGEWDGAAATSGFACLDLDWALAPPWLQTTVWLGWDEANLYLAMRAPYEGQPMLSRAVEHDDGGIFLDDHLEWQILPDSDRRVARQDGGGFFKFMVNPGGRILDQRMDGAKPAISDAWQAQAEIRTGVQDGAWITEMRVPAKAFGAAPAAGSTWIMQVMRTFGGSHFHGAWTPGGWLEWHRFPSVQFADAGPGVQLLGVTAGNGSLVVDAALLAPVERAASAIARLRPLDGSGRIIERRLDADAGARTAASLRFDGLPVQDGEMEAELTIEEAGALLGRWRWRCFLPDDPELADLRESWLRDRGRYGILGTLAELARTGQPLARRVGAALERKDFAGAEAAARELIAALPRVPDGHRLLAAVLVRAGKPAAALDALEAAARAGDTDAAGLEEDLDFAPLRGEPRLAAIAARMRASPGWLPRQQGTPAPARRRAVVDDGNCSWDPDAQQVVAHWLPVRARSGAGICAEVDEVGARLQRWWVEGTAAGNAGDLYDNRDSGHSHLREGLFPQVNWITYRLAARDAGLHDALPEGIRHQGPVTVIGNASEAEVSGPFRRCLPRRALVQPRSAARLAWQYAHNQVYAYPACFDFQRHDDRNGLGDAFPALTPYWVASIGYSGTDQPFLNALFAALAALRPEVKARLLAEQRLAPTLQMLLRRSLKGIDSDEAYLGARAHPAAFSGADLRPALMADLAHAITPTTLPPTVRLRVVEEDAPAVPGRDFFDAPGRTEALLDSPAAIARVMRSARKGSWRLVVGAEAGAGAEGRPVAVRWAVLRGEAALAVRDGGTAAEITVPWQGRHDAGGGSGMLTDRIDVVCAAHDGIHWSAPAFISFYAPAHETRTYRPDGRIASVVYAGARDAAPYADPMVCLPKSWRDEYRWDEAGTCLGWTRSSGDRQERFDAQGRLLQGAGPDERSVEVAYGVQMEAGGKASITCAPRP